MRRVIPFLVLLAPLVAFLAALLLSRAMMWLAPWLGYLDHPSARKQHKSPTPLLGGLAIAIAFAAALGLSHALGGIWPRALASNTRVFIAAALAMLALGLYDDRAALKPLPKFIALCAASALPALLMCHAGFSLIEALSLVAALLFFSNAFNLLDNSDGQCASVATAALCAAALHGHTSTRLAAAGALLGFLCWNWPPARIFLGDAGSLLIGAWCVMLVLRNPAHDGFLINPHLLPALWVPLYDTLSVIALRLWQRRPIWQGGQDHFAWRLMRRGLSPATTDVALAAATFLPACLTLVLPAYAGWFLTPTLLLATFLFELFTTLSHRQLQPHT